MVGLVIGYERWGTTVALVSIVEREVAGVLKRVYTLEKKIGVLKTRTTEIMQGGRKLDGQTDVPKSRIEHTSRIPSN